MRQRRLNTNTSLNKVQYAKHDKVAPDVLKGPIHVLPDYASAGESAVVFICEHEFFSIKRKSKDGLLDLTPEEKEQYVIVWKPDADSELSKFIRGRGCV